MAIVPGAADLSQELPSGNNVLGQVQITNSGGVADTIDQGTHTGLGVVILDGSGDPISSFGGGTQYTDGGTPPANPVGPTLIWDDAGTWKHVSDTDPLPTTASVDTTGLATSAKQDTIIGHVDGIETLLTAIDGHVDGVEGALANLLTTSAHDAAFGTAGSADSQVRSIQGISGMTAVQVGDNSSSLSVDWNGTQPVTGSGNATGALRVELANNGTGLVGLNAGSNAIGKLAANSGVDIGDVDVTSLPALVAGTAYIGKVLPPDRDITLHTNYVKKYYTNSGAVTDGIIWSPASGTRWHVVSMYLQTSAAATITLEDDLAGGDSAVWKGEFAANQGMTINFGEWYPLASGEDAADLIITTSAGNIYVTVTGYEI